MFEESTRLQDIRLERLKDLQIRHQNELAEFDTVSRRHAESPRSSRSGSNNSPRFNRAVHGGARHSNRSLGAPISAFQQQANRVSSVSMTSLQSTGSSRSSVSSQYTSPNQMHPAHSVSNVVTRTRNSDSRNGNIDRLSYHESSRR